MLNKSSSVVSVGILVAALLAGCGGGSGSGDVVVPVKNLPLAVSASSSISLQAGTSSNFKITGGGSGSAFVQYTASSSNGAATVSISGDTLTVAGKNSGSGKITVLDSASNTVVFDFVITASSSLLPFKVNAPSQIKLPLNTAGNYKIIGGVQPYTATSSNSNVTAANIINGSELELKGIKNGTASIVVFDAIGTPFNISTLIGEGDAVASILYSTAPSKVNLKSNSMNSYVVGGGTPPYYSTTSNPSVLKATITNSILEVSTLTSGLSSVVVTDSKGLSLKFDVDVFEVFKPLFITAPASVTLAPSSSTTFTVAGGTPPYYVSSSNNTVVSANIVSGTLTVSAMAAGASSVVVFDSEGKTQQFNVSVNTSTTPFFTTAPSSIFLKIGETGSYQVTGGRSPYTAVSNNTSVSVASINGSNLSIESKSVGLATIIVRDSSGSLSSIAVTNN
jgi:hypothetical protein